MNDNIWTVLAGRLAAALRENPDALLRHFLATASEDQIAAIAGDALPSTENTRRSTLRVLHEQLSAPGQ